MQIGYMRISKDEQTTALQEVQMEGGIGRIVQYHLPIYHGQTHLQDFFGQNRLIERFFKYSKNSKVNVAVLLGYFKTGSS